MSCLSLVHWGLLGCVLFFPSEMTSSKSDNGQVQQYPTCYGSQGSGVVDPGVDEVILKPRIEPWLRGKLVTFEPYAINFSMESELDVEFWKQVTSAEFVLVSARLVWTHCPAAPSAPTWLTVIPASWINRIRSLSRTNSSHAPVGLESSQKVARDSTGSVARIISSVTCPEFADISGVPAWPGCIEQAPVHSWKEQIDLYDLQAPHTISWEVNCTNVQNLHRASNSTPLTFEMDITSAMLVWLAQRDPWARHPSRYSFFPILLASHVPDFYLQLHYRKDDRCIVRMAEPLEICRRTCERVTEVCRFHRHCITCCGLSCDFEANDTDCNWTWHGFSIKTGSEINASIFQAPDASQVSGPLLDIDNRPEGRFLYMAAEKDGEPVQISSPWYNESGPNCQLQMALHMHNMDDANLNIIVETKNHTWVIVESLGNSLREWRTLYENVGRITQTFRLTMELLPGSKLPSHAAVDSIRLENCFADLPPKNECFSDPLVFHCNDGRCLNRDQVCDIKKDCLNGEDEEQNCDDVPKGARCDFESGWCGWNNSSSDELDWTMHNGATPTDSTGPSHDNTFKNATGMYLYVDMSAQASVIGNAAVLHSSRFPPPPKYHSDPHSAYFNSCSLRFFYHMFGNHIGEFVVHSVEGRHGKMVELFRDTKDRGDFWRRAVVKLPQNIKFPYYLQFTGARGLRFRGDVAVDDVTLSPECFGMNVHPNETGAFDGNGSEFTGQNFTRYTFSTCEARGRLGPSHQNCQRAYANTHKENVQVLRQGRLAGIQVWTVPATALYTIIARGASGGGPADSSLSSSLYGSSHGSVVRAVLPLSAGSQLYMLIGQEGVTARRENGKTKSDVTSGVEDRSTVKGSVELIKTIITKNGGGGGGGGGATFLFKLDIHLQPIPLVIAAGGGGFSHTPHKMSEPAWILPNGRGFNASTPGIPGRGVPRGAGGGGGWNGTRENEATGYPLVEGGLGGYACQEMPDLLAHGGFGGGGGGCAAGGGGGGYAGGQAYTDLLNGEGGFSFVADAEQGVTWPYIEVGTHLGPGSVDILQAVDGCGCQYLCIALDSTGSDTQCVCPEGWRLTDNETTCEMISGKGGALWFLDAPYLAGLIVFLLLIVAVISLVCVCLYNRYQRRKLAVLRRKALAGPELQLSRLRGTSSGMVTEYNPNYEFGGGTCTVQDLKEIPRENLRLVRALGQGAFGEVYQGYLRHVAGDSVEMPVAVKTLPELSSNQAEMDFLMEALIMSKFHHPNIVHFIGVCFDKHPRFIVLELLSGGDLKTFLRDARPKPERPSPLTMKDLLKCALDVAKGCRYLEENHFIHRDIAARNCLLTTKGPGRVVKIADFGMARDIYRADYYRKGGKAMLPVKWMPPEAFLDGIFTSKTDVWSFGVLLWEVMSLGYMPYPGRGNQEVMQLVTNGGRLEAPSGCPGPVYRIMTQCWHPSPEERPTFATVLERLGYCIQDPDILSAPLPVFHRPPSNERDTTIVRPPHAAPDTETCLRVVRKDAANGPEAANKNATHLDNGHGGQAHGHGPISPLSGSSSADYLIPLSGSPSTGLVERGERLHGLGHRADSGYWETSFTREGVKAIARGDAAAPVAAPNGDHLRRRRSGGYAAVPVFESALGLTSSQSSQPLLVDGSPPESPTLSNHDRARSRSGSRSRSRESMPLNAGVLCRQAQQGTAAGGGATVPNPPLQYANVSVAFGAGLDEGGNVFPGGPYRSPSSVRQQTDTLKDNEISC